MKIKICGITHPEDAGLAASFGADYIGMIFASKSKRKVSISLAKDIVNVSKNMGAEPVGVFLDQTVDQIISICKQTGIKIVQLHGFSQNALNTLIADYMVIYAISVKENGSILDKRVLPSSVIPLYDNATSGIGIPFNWEMFKPSENGFWILAGGLNIENVKTAISLLKPGAVDVATGVEFANVTRKDPVLLEAFIKAVKK